MGNLHKCKQTNGDVGYLQKCKQTMLKNDKSVNYRDGSVNKGKCG